MRYKKLGKTGLNVSVFCLGTMVFGDQINEKDSTKIIRSAFDSGVNYFDTANVYTNFKSEETKLKPQK